MQVRVSSRLQTENCKWPERFGGLPAPWVPVPFTLWFLAGRTLGTRRNHPSSRSSSRSLSGPRPGLANTEEAGQHPDKSRRGQWGQICKMEYSGARGIEQATGAIIADAVCEVGNDGSTRGRRESRCQNGDRRFAKGMELARWTSFALLSGARRGWTADGTDESGWDGTPSPDP